MKRLVNFYGGPCSGKSVSAAHCYGELSKAPHMSNKRIELVREWIKAWAYEGRTPTTDDAITVMGNQIREETIVFEHNDVVITDCPIAITVFYADPLYRNIMLDLLMARNQRLADEGVKQFHFWVRRRGVEYQPQGRLHTLEESLQIDKEMHGFLSAIGYELEEV